MKRHIAFMALAAAALASPAIAQQARASYQCGGVGQAEQQRMKSEAAAHDAMLTFAVANGAYLADVDVRITDAQGRTALQARCDGPIMLLDLPSNGRWHVSATAEGLTRQTVLEVGSKPAHKTLVWPLS